MDTITIELRSRLRSCNIFISTVSTTSAPNGAISLKLNESEITMKIAERTSHLILNSVKIIPKTLSSLTVTDDWISLRVQTEPIEAAYGSFKREIVGAKVENSSSKPKKERLSCAELNLKDKNLVVLCTRCKNELTDVVRLKKVLPLPSGNSDPGEWFCCNHAATTAGGESYKSLTEPTESDCFYERDYKVLNEKIFKKESTIRYEDEENTPTTAAVRCNRCLSGVGLRNSEWGNAGVKLWNCCVDYKFTDDVAAGDPVMRASDPLKDFASIIVDRTDIFTGNKLLVQSSDGNNRWHYLIVRVMDQNLELLVEKDFFSNHPISPAAFATNNEEADYTVELISNRVTKVLYKYSETEADIKSHSIDVDRCQVALPVMLAAVEHLSNTTKRYPPSCRIVDKYFVGYICTS